MQFRVSSAAGIYDIVSVDGADGTLRRGPADPRSLGGDDVVHGLPVLLPGAATIAPVERAAGFQPVDLGHGSRQRVDAERRLREGVAGRTGSAAVDDGPRVSVPSTTSPTRWGTCSGSSGHIPPAARIRRALPSQRVGVHDSGAGAARHPRRLDHRSVPLQVRVPLGGGERGTEPAVGEDELVAVDSGWARAVERGSPAAKLEDENSYMDAIIGPLRSRGWPPVDSNFLQSHSSGLEPWR